VRAAPSFVRRPGVDGPTTEAVPMPSEPTRIVPTLRDPLAEEARMLEEARAATDRDPTRALAILDAHASTFPAGALTVEREFMAIDVLSRLGQYAQARTRASALLLRARGSIYEKRVRTRLADLPPP
jgi:hypothetical protein